MNPRRIARTLLTIAVAAFAWCVQPGYAAVHRLRRRW